MNTYTIRDNLKRTIAGKEALLAKYDKDAIKAEDNVSMAIAFARKEFLRINLDELRNILADVEKCCEIATANSWIGVDRQGGI